MEVMKDAVRLKLLFISIRQVIDKTTTWIISHRIFIIPAVSSHIQHVIITFYHRVLHDSRHVFNVSKYGSFKSSQTLWNNTTPHPTGHISQFKAIEINQVDHTRPYNVCGTLAFVCCATSVKPCGKAYTNCDVIKTQTELNL